MIAALIPYAFPLAGALALASIARDLRAYSPMIRATLRDALEL